MTKILKVIKPFFIMEVGDTFELSEDKEFYVSEYNEGTSSTDDDNNTMKAEYTSKYTISLDYAKMLINEGFLEEVTQPTGKHEFVNVFDEINNLINQYKEDLSMLDETTKDQPACLKVERETVLRNLIKVLEYLLTLRRA